MLSVEPRSLLKKLNPSCTRALEAAAGSCLSHQHYEVTVEHLMLALLEEAESDLRAIFEHYKIDVGTAIGQVERSLGELRRGNAGKPVFSSLLLEWLEDAWLLGSIEYGLTQIRSLPLLVRLVTLPLRYLPNPFPFLELLPRDALRKDGLLHASKSGESLLASATGEVGSGTGARGSGEQTALGRFASDLTERARAGEIDPVFGREREIRQMIEILVRRRKNNPIIVGEAGVGKTALVEGLARRIVEGTVPEALRTARLLSLDLGSLQAGAGVKGEFENRLKAVLNEVKASPIPILLFIDEAHTLIGAGNAQGAGDAANLLKPALARGELRTIAATTYAEFKKYFEKDAALERRFQPVRVDEPGAEAAIVMIRGLAREFERVHGVTIHDSAVTAAVELSSRYISGRQLPDKAVDLLDTSAAYVKLVRAAPPPSLEDLRAELAALSREREALLADTRAGLPPEPEALERVDAKRAALMAREAELTEELDAQRELVARLDAARKGDGKNTAQPTPEDAAKNTAEPAPEGTATVSAPAEGGEGSTTAKPSADQQPEPSPELRAILEEWQKIPRERRLVAPDVDASVVERIVADWTGIPVGNMVRDNLATILGLEQRLKERVIGQDHALSAIARELRASQAGLKNPAAPLGVFLLVGPSGVGKTETGLALAQALFGGERFMVTINMSEFQERHTVSRLIGSPPGYVGYGEGGVLTEAVRHRPYSLVLLDEVEKADREVMNIFYQVFDKGMLADGEGRIIDFKNTVIVMTSNLATDLLTEAAHPTRPTPGLDELVELVRPTLVSYFKPALLARMSVVPYIPIGPSILTSIVRQKLDAVVERARARHRIELRIDEVVYQSITDRCTEVDSGARTIDHVLRRSVLPVVSSAILEALAQDQGISALELGLDGTGFVVRPVSTPSDPTAEQSREPISLDDSEAP